MAYRITANLPATLEKPLRVDVRERHYSSESDYGVGVILWDVYSRQQHTLTGPLMRLPRWEVEANAEKLAVDLGFNQGSDARAKMPFRYTVTVPAPLVPLVKLRIKEEHYRSASAYITGLIFFALKEQGPKRVPHHKCSPLLREPDWIRANVFQQLAKDFGKPDRKWPKDLDGRINDLIDEQKREGEAP